MSSSLIESRDENLSKDIYEEEKNLFEAESTAMYRKIRNGSEHTNKSVIFIRKNDSIKTRITQIIDLVESQTEPLLIIGKSNTISKMLTICELLKAKIKETNHTTALKQYNKISKQSSLNNPNYKQLSKTTKQKNNVESFMNGSSIHGHKIYQLPILYILFVPKEDAKLELSGWTRQE